MLNNPLSMTSVEAAALYLSQGKTTDPVLADMYDRAEGHPELLLPKGTIPERDYQPPALVIEDPEVAERKRLHQAIGFDMEVVINEAKSKVVFKDLERGYTTRCKLTDDEAANSVAMSRAVLRLKTKHEATND